MRAAERTRRSQVQRLIQADFDEFTTANPLAIVRVFRGKGTPFLEPVAQHFMAEYPGLVSAEIDINPIVYSGWAERHLGRRPPSLDWPIGYHLFADAKCIAYHPGERPLGERMDWGEFGVQLASIARGTNAGLDAIDRKQHAAKAKLVIDAFEKALSERTPNPPSSEQLNDPWKILGVDPSASDQELVDAHRGLVSQYHPDIVARAGPEIRELANTRLTQINGAWDEIKQLRGL